MSYHFYNEHEAREFLEANRPEARATVWGYPHPDNGRMLYIVFIPNQL